MVSAASTAKRPWCAALRVSSTCAARSSRTIAADAASASDAQGLQIVTGDVGQQFITLRGVAETLSINFNGVTIAGGAVNVTFEWMES